MSLHQRDREALAGFARNERNDWISPCGRISLGLTGVVGRWMVDVDGVTLRGRWGRPRYFKWAESAMREARRAITPSPHP